MCNATDRRGEKQQRIRVTVDEGPSRRSDVSPNSHRAQPPSHLAAGRTAFEKPFQDANEIMLSFKQHMILRNSLTYLDLWFRNY